MKPRSLNFLIRLSMKKTLFPLLAATLSLSAQAAGYIDQFVNNGDTHYYAGWACNPDQPHELATVHVWSGDVFLGVLPINGNREQAVADLCGGTYFHAFSGSVTIPESLKTGAIREVSLTYVGATNAVLYNSPVTAQFPGTPVPPPPVVTAPRSVTVNTCIDKRPGPGWIVQKRAGSGVCATEWIDERNLRQTRGYIEEWVSSADLQQGHEMLSCDTPYPTHMDWTVSSEIASSDQCVVFQNYGYGYARAYRIRKGPPSQPRTMKVHTCTDKRPESGWVVTGRVASGVCSTVWIDERNLTQTRGFIEEWTFDADLPQGHETLACDSPYPSNMNWTVIGEVTSSTVCAGFYGNGYSYAKAHRIRKGQPAPSASPRSMKINTCVDKRPGPGWLVNNRAPTGICSTNWIDANNLTQTRGYIEDWVYDNDLPVNHEMVSCDDPALAHPNWSLLETRTSVYACQFMSGINYYYATGYRIRKIQ